MSKNIPDDLVLYLVLISTALIYSTIDNETYFKFIRSCNTLFGVSNDSNEQITAFYLHYCVTNSIYWIYAGFLTLLETNDYTRKLLAPYKIQPTKYCTRDQFIKAAIQVFTNQIIVNAPVCYLLYRGMLWRNLSIWDPLPSLPTVFFHAIGFLLIEEIGFYYSHLLAHHPKLYKYVHKRHHEFTAPTAVAALYAHPIEHWICNLTPLALGPFIMGSHFLLTILWTSSACIYTINSHCGYKLPGMPSPEQHDFHHSSFNYNFGLLGILDTIHGTNKGFIEYKRKMSTLN